jgi:hypothetical protein
VEAQEVVPIQSCAGNRSVEVKASRGTVEVVVMKPAIELLFSFRGVLVGAGVGPLAQGGLDEAFCVAVGARGIGSVERRRLIPARRRMRLTMARLRRNSRAMRQPFQRNRRRAKTLSIRKRVFAEGSNADWN